MLTAASCKPPFHNWAGACIQISALLLQARMPLRCLQRRISHFYLLCRMYTPETGSVLNRMVHFYAYESLDDRDRCRKRMLEKQQWTDFLQRSRPCVLGPQVCPMFFLECKQFCCVPQIQSLIRWERYDRAMPQGCSENMSHHAFHHAITTHETQAVHWNFC